MVEATLPPGIIELDELEILVIVDNETDTLSSIDEGVPQIPEVVQHAARTPPSRTFEGHDCKVVFDQLCCACHGFSVLLKGKSGEATRTALFDVGPYPDLWLDNAKRLAVDLSAMPQGAPPVASGVEESSDRHEQQDATQEGRGIEEDFQWAQEFVHVGRLCLRTCRPGECCAGCSAGCACEGGCSWA